VSAGVEVLYRDVLVEHARHPHNRREVPDATLHAEIENPLCGDRVTVYATVADGVVRDASFMGDACAVATASASMMTDAVCGTRAADIAGLFAVLQAFLRGDTCAPGGTELGAFVAFAGVREFPARIRCAELPWHALLAALAAGPGARTG